MEFLYVFSLMFLLIFGLAALIKVVAWAILARGASRHDVFVRSSDDIGGLVEAARKCPHVRRVIILAAGSECDEEARQLAEKYSNVCFYQKTER